MNPMHDDAPESFALNWVKTSPAHACAVLLIHPVGFDLTYWDRQIEALQSIYTVVAFDLPGHGRSPGSPRDYSSFDRTAAVVANLIERLADGGDRPAPSISSASPSAACSPRPLRWRGPT